MYITHNNQTYANVRVYSTSGSVRFTGDSLSGVTTLTGPVVVFADNGFELRTFVPIDYLRQDIKDGSWLPSLRRPTRRQRAMWSSSAPACSSLLSL